MAKQKLGSLRTLSQIKAALPSSTPRSTGKGRGKQVMALFPEETYTALRKRAGDEQTTIRALLLQALHKAGYPVPATELKDRRQQA